MKVTAKCTNHSGCLRAYRGEVIELDSGAPQVCPECGKPLTPAGGGSAGIIKLAAIGVGVIVIALGAFFAVKSMSKKDGTPSAVVDPGGATTPGGSDSSTPSTDSAPVTAADLPPVVPDEPPPAPPVPVNEKGDDSVKKEVLARIDKMPNLTSAQRDKLYNSVQRAREMRRVVEIPFGSGQADIPEASKPVVKGLLQDPAIMKLRDELTTVFVVLGFADTKGNQQQNLRISDIRAKSVVKFMETQCGVTNVTHSVAMGGTTMVDKANVAKNRVVEIWIVLP
jgi:outer membrane protein OmpA-like peptidoglycan-associated protein